MFYVFNWEFKEICLNITHTYTEWLIVEIIHHNDRIFLMHEHSMKFRQISFLSHQKKKPNFRKYNLSAHIRIVDFDCVIMGILFLGWFCMVNRSIAASSNLLDYSKTILLEKTTVPFLLTGSILWLNFRLFYLFCLFKFGFLRIRLRGLFFAHIIKYCREGKRGKHK